LYQRQIANRFEAVDLACLDDKDVSSPAFEGLAIDCPHSATSRDEMDLVI